MKSEGLQIHCRLSVKPLERTMRALIFLAMICPLLQGCVGVVVLKTRTTVINDPVIPFYTEIPQPVSKQNSPEVTNTVVYTSEWLRTYWNNPDCVSHGAGNSEEIWTYKSRRVWKGVVPFAIIPIPLILPVGQEKVCLTLRDGRVVSASTTRSATVGGTYGFIPPGPEGRGGGWGADSWNYDTTN
jgi:hypothetical protein